MTNITLQLDIAWDYYDTPEYKSDLAKYDIEDKLIELEGPAGGNPLVEFKSTKFNLLNLLTEWNYDPSDIEYYLEQM